jgi:hypothetical protein
MEEGATPSTPEAKINGFGKERVPILQFNAELFGPIRVYTRKEKPRKSKKFYLLRHTKKSTHL